MVGHVYHDIHEHHRHCPDLVAPLLQRRKNVTFVPDRPFPASQVVRQERFNSRGFFETAVKAPVGFCGYDPKEEVVEVLGFASGLHEVVLVEVHRNEVPCFRFHHRVTTTPYTPNPAPSLFCCGAHLPHELRHRSQSKVLHSFPHYTTTAGLGLSVGQVSGGSDGAAELGNKHAPTRLCVCCRLHFVHHLPPYRHAPLRSLCRRNSLSEDARSCSGSLFTSPAPLLHSSIPLNTGLLHVHGRLLLHSHLLPPAAPVEKEELFTLLSHQSSQFL
mmetsp:Transcript_57280/g.114937  ORF Transcript_57280/g.114937 Transcript_57280/m.114937 type:complete len:273 (-) Transcript_57280:1025-1843(-)